ncbi:DUF4350 domain-containing protein [Spirulina sp. 06S082]|uniref:DUF4350 domain-containing protein n=1 Tax=Spirulina sp. 06S082 TaxID=3110248 RepID=UPI002B219953|nr:DUF4350 domain-containing protein [Spirulina sp. 06S082]MEA5471710.1 DUF4350 domain-containing protein [Spirulina sp. 06S082]
MNFQRKSIKFGAIALFIVILITLFVAPNNSTNQSGSTYNRAPDGYGAWYEFIQNEWGQDKNIQIQRWKKSSLPPQTKDKNPITLVRAYSDLIPSQSDSSDDFKSSFFSDSLKKWIKKGNTIVILGWHQPSSKAVFKTQHSTAFGTIEIETTRRAIDRKEILLGDDFGAIVWQQKLGQGQAIFTTTPYLAANAYQDSLANYKFLSDIVLHPNTKTSKNKTIEVEFREQNNSPRNIFVDEYIHGYQDKETRQNGQKDSVLKYFSQTSLLPVFIQGVIILLMVIFALNRRFGKPQKFNLKSLNNSRVYIEALAAVLQKAANHDFVIDVVGKEEQLQLQKKLGLDNQLLDEKTVIDAWVQQTGKPAKLLEDVMNIKLNSSQIGEIQLLQWLQKWQEIHRS